LKSKTTERFRKAYSALPPHVQDRAKVAYAMFAADASHPSLRFKQVHPTRPIYSARVGLAYRALCVRATDEYVWFWIGTHDEYERLIASL
jgi:hypothetical protein